MLQLSWEYKVTAFCLLLSTFFCLLLGAEWWYARGYRAEMLQELFKVNKASFEMQAIPEYPFSNFPVEHYADLMERPVFFQGRKPIVKVVESETPVEPVVKPPVEEFKYVLTGVINTPKGVKVLFQDPAAKDYADKFKKLTQGEILGGWKLIDIQADKVSIQAETETKEILLLKAKPKNPVPGIFPPPGGAPRPGSAQSPAGTQPKIPPNVNPFNVKH